MSAPDQTELERVKAEREELQRRADELEAAANNASSAADFTEAPIAYAALRSALNSYNQLKGQP